ncbi:SDR family oxidoreductase [Acidisphaera sp. L21]|uniref:SDR family oxidoreductase n=1 Tax=Acidisphaera sp. L21 TaxID=1641851 RepID=UPI00131AB6AC|nr:SDR family oxidoreductase [Acidisphaera sp. L21]
MADQKIAVITGATAGLGRWVALGLARAGYHTVIVARDAARGEDTRRWIASQARGAVTELMLADLSSLKQTREVGQAIAAAHPRIDVLVNNAGLITPKRQVTMEGREMILAVNHLAPFVLTDALLPALRAGAPSRVVNVGSTASDRANLKVDDLEGERSWYAMSAYCRSKLALMMATFERARRLEGTGVAVNVVHPGVVATTLGTVPGPVGWGWAALRPFMITPEQGARTPLHLALSPLVEGATGRYWKRSRPARPNRQALDYTLVRQLWRETERLIG